MASEPDVDPATLRFQLALPKTAQAISPTLAALHITRTRLLYYGEAGCRAFDTTHCQRCGIYLLEGTGSVRTARRSTKKAGVGAKVTTVLRRSCGVCGGRQDVPIDAGNMPVFPRVGKTQSKSGLVPQPQIKDMQPVEKAVLISQPLSSAPTSAAPSSSRPSPMPGSQRTLPVAKPTPQDIQHADGRSKARAKKKSGLQEMLARSKERQEKERAGLNGGLAAFLQDL